ncbi:MAG: adenosine kinase [Actinobacteria bacterium]|nr:adenosine kinase [Actinomycetota bacterium]
MSDITFVPRDLTNNPGISYDVVGLGNALVDVIAQTDDAFLEQQQLAKGSMALVDTDRAVSLYEALHGGVEMSGGSAANTMCGIASFGGRAAYIGKVAEDTLGDTFSKDMQVVGVDFKRPVGGNSVPTGRCIIAVTPDAQRTMNTFLGISSLLTPADLDHGAIAAGAVLYLEGYLYDQPEAKIAFRGAAEIAHQHNRQVSLTLSDSFCVDRHRADFRALISDEIDILFGNEAELLALYETDTFEFAVTQLRQDCIVAAITRGEHGSVVVTKDGVIEVPAQPVAQVVDTTGAGDLYAAGFLYGYTRGMDLNTCATLGHIASAEVISHVGPRPQIALSSLLPAS